MKVSHPTVTQRAITVAWARVHTTKIDRDRAWVVYAEAPPVVPGEEHSDQAKAKLQYLSAAKNADILYWHECASLIELLQSDPVMQSLQRLLTDAGDQNKADEIVWIVTGSIK